MWKFNTLPLAVFLLTVVGGEREDFQSYLPEQTKGTAVTKYTPLENAITIVHGTEAVPSQTTHRGTEEEPTAEFPKVNVVDTKLKPTNEGMPTTSLAATLQSMGNILSSNVQNSLKSSTAFRSESKVPLKSDYAKIVSSSTQAALVLTDTFEPHVHLSAKAVKAPPWFSVPHANGIHKNANSVIPTSADTGLLPPIQSASPPHVIDNLTELFNGSDDLRPQEKNITNLGENVALSSTMQFILHADPTKDSMKGNDATDLCLTCLKERKAMSSEKFAVSPTASPHFSLGSLSLTSLNSFHSSSTGESKEAKESNNFKNAINYNHTTLPFTQNKTERKTVSFFSHIAAELSSEKHKFTTLPPRRTYPSKMFVTASPKLISIAQNPSSKPSYTGEKPVKHGHQQIFNKNVSMREPRSNPMPFTQRKEKAPHSLSTSLKNQDISTEPVSNVPFIAPLSSFNRPFQKGRAHATASHPTRMNSIEALVAITPFTFRRLTVSTVKNLKSCFLPGKDGAFISVSNSQTKPKPSFQTKQSILTLLPKDLTITHKQSPVNLQTTVSTTAMTRVQTSTFSTRKVRLKVFDFDISQSALTGLKSMSFNKKQKEAQSKIIEGRDSEGNRPDSKLIDLHNIRNLTLGDKQESILNVVTETEDKDTLPSNSNHGGEITKMFLKEDGTLENKRQELLRLDDPEIEKRAAQINQSPYREAGEMKEFITKTRREEHVLLRHDKNTQHGEVKDERDAKREGVTKINTQNSTLDTAGKQRQFLEKKGAKAASGEDRKFNKDIGKEDVTNVPPEPAPNWKELIGDKERIVEKLSSCHGLIKELDGSEHKGIHLVENASQIRDLTDKSFSFEVTSNRQLPHPSVRSQAPDRTEEDLPKEDIMLPLKEKSSQKFEVTFPVATVSKMSGFISMFTPLIPPSRGAATTAKQPSLTTRFQRAKSHFTVSSSLNVSIIQSNTDHMHKLNSSVLGAEQVLHTANEQGHAEYAKLSIYQQRYDDSSTKTPTVTVLSFKPRISVGPFQPHRGQSATQRSHSSSSCPNITPGQTCLSRVSEQASHPDTLHTPAVANKQRFPEARTSSVIPATGINRFSPESVSPMMKLRTLSGDRLTVTYRLQKLSRSQLAHFVPGSKSRASLLAAAGETSQRKKEGDAMFMMTSVVKHSNGVTGDQHTTVSSKCVANDTDEFNSTSLQTKNETKQNDLSAAGGKHEANNIIMTAKHHRFELEKAMPYTVTATNGKFGHDTNYADTADRVGTTTIFQTDDLPERPKIQSDDEPDSLFDIELRLAKTNVRHNRQPLSQQSESNNSDLITNRNSSTDRAIHKVTHQTFDQARHIISQFQINANKTADFVSLTETPAEFRGFKSLLATSGTLPDSKKFTQKTAEYRSQPYAHTNPLTQRELPITHTFDKLTPAVLRIKTMETHSVQEQQEEEILVRAAEQGQHALLSMTALTHVINIAESVFSEVAHRAKDSYVQTSAASEQMSYLSLKGIKLVPLNVYAENSQDWVDKHKNHTLPKKTSISQAIFGHVTDFVPLAEIPPTEFVNKISCSNTGCTKADETTEAVVIDPTKEMLKTRLPEKNNFLAQNANKTKSGSNSSFHRSLPGKSAPQAVKLKVLHLSVTSKREQDYTSDDTVSTKAKSTSDDTVHSERKDTPQWTRFVTTTTQRPFQNTSGVVATEGTLSESGTAAVETTIMSTEKTLPVEGNTKTQLDRRAGRARMLAEQNVSRSLRAHAKDETASPESGSRLLVSEPQTKSELPRLNQRRRTSPHQYVSGVTEISDDICGSGNYTAEMSLKMGTSVEPGDAVAARGNLRVIINLKTSNSQINLGVTACCLSPTRQLDFDNSTCCFSFRPGAEPPGITLLPSALSTSASFTISLFQMINYSVVYLHCDLSVCLRNHSDCERQCRQQRSMFPSEGADTVMANLQNRISFGPVLKQAKNSTFPTEIDPSQLDLVLVFVSLVVGFSLISLLLLLVWLAYHRRAIWLLQSAAPSQACCGCLRPGGDLISP